ncbi:hypothetical protein [Pedococcus sp. 5OH_020]|uniref:hypothetical protein n=1 Tax=Pedococcus sp. 5OH_020 TaxID=2989814 RepID=UPI0022E9D0A6|nr:hypothetical protein [Pedococcus sp. 5OH_020]
MTVRERRDPSRRRVLAVDLALAVGTVVVWLLARPRRTMLAEDAEATSSAAADHERLDLPPELEV